MSYCSSSSAAADSESTKAGGSKGGEREFKLSSCLVLLWIACVLLWGGILIPMFWVLIPASLPGSVRHWPLEEPTWGEEDEKINLSGNKFLLNLEARRTKASMSQTTPIPNAELTMEVQNWQMPCRSLLKDEVLSVLLEHVLTHMLALLFLWKVQHHPPSQPHVMLACGHATPPDSGAEMHPGALWAEEIIQAIVHPANAFSRCFVWKSVEYLLHTFLSTTVQM